MSVTQRHYEARGRLQRLCIRYGCPSDLVDADQSRLLLCCPYYFRLHDTLALVIARREGKVLCSFSNAVYISFFLRQAMHSGISARADSAFQRRLQDGVRLSHCQWRVDLINSRYILSQAKLAPCVSSMVERGYRSACSYRRVPIAMVRTGRP